MAIQYKQGCRTFLSTQLCKLYDKIQNYTKGNDKELLKTCPYYILHLRNCRISLVKLTGI